MQAVMQIRTETEETEDLEVHSGDLGAEASWEMSINYVAKSELNPLLKWPYPLEDCMWQPSMKMRRA